MIHRTAATGATTDIGAIATVPGRVGRDCVRVYAAALRVFDELPGQIARAEHAQQQTNGVTGSPYRAEENLA